MSSSKENVNYWVALNMITGVGCVRIKKLLERFGTPEGILSASKRDLQGVEGVGGELAGRIAKWQESVDIKKEFEVLKNYGANVLTVDDEKYPSRLKEIYDPPVVLYVRGEITPADERAIAIVGTRRPSFYGRSITEDLSKKLAVRGFTIVSGLARGIDSAAHRGALAVKGRTIAVLGCGVDMVYPPENEELMKQVMASGAVISEFPLGTQPDRGNFPRRNRIISGLSVGVIVVEAAKNSGSLITAGAALEQGREVFAVPGKVDSPTSYGTHRLIKEGAKLVQDVDDVVEELGMLRVPSREDSLAGKESEKLGAPSGSAYRQAGAGVSPDLAGDEKRIYEILSSDPCQIDAICSQTSMPASKVSSVLMILEIKGLVKQLPGKEFVKAQ